MLTPRIVVLFVAAGLLRAADVKPLPYARAEFVVPPVVFLPHLSDRVFIGPGTTRLPNGDVLMLAPWGSAPAKFEELRGTYPLPHFYRSADHGRTWREEGRIAMDWKIGGTTNNGGFSFLRLQDGRLALAGHRYVADTKGGGVPFVSFSSDNGATWTPARLVGAPETPWYVMNDRLIQTRRGRLLLPACRAVPGSGPEGDLGESGCFYSDDAGASWKVSQLVLPKGALRGMAEPCVAELPDGKILMLARSGTGYLVGSWSSDGGATWSPPQNTPLLSPCTSLTLKTLPDGRLIVFYNHVKEDSPGSLFPRCPLVYAVSSDGHHWSEPVIVDDEGWDPVRPTRENIYPSICFLDEGMLVMWSTHFSTAGMSRRTLEENQVGGGKRAILKYPAADKSSAMSSTQSHALPYPRAQFVVPPEVVFRHAPGRTFIGPGTIQLRNGDLMLAAPWGRPPANFAELSRTFPVPEYYLSSDHGRSWRSAGQLKLEWKVDGLISDGGISFLRLADGRLAFLTHRHLPNNQGGGLPVISYSSDEGATWTPAQVVGKEVAADDPWYVMNDRLVQLKSGRILVPMAHAMAYSRGEGDIDEAVCFYSDDAGATWRRSQPAPLPEGPRGMPEASLAELRDGRVLMLTRSGTGFLLKSYSSDGGATWSAPRNTTLVSPCSSLTLRTMPDGKLIVFYNHVAPFEPGGFFPRSPLVYAVSSDQGETWGGPTIVDDEGWDPAHPTRESIYPSVCFLDEGMLVIWSTHYSDSTFSAKTPEQLLLGGGKRAILKYP